MSLFRVKAAQCNGGRKERTRARYRKGPERRSPALSLCGMAECVFEPPLQLKYGVTVHTLDEAANVARRYVGTRLPRCAAYSGGPPGMNKGWRPRTHFGFGLRPTD
jgi:hypothetical protein